MGIHHMQLAGVPDRIEPCDGEVNYPYVFKIILSWATTAGLGASTNLEGTIPTEVCEDGGVVIPARPCNCVWHAACSLSLSLYNQAVRMLLSLCV